MWLELYAGMCREEMLTRRGERTNMEGPTFRVEDMKTGFPPHFRSTGNSQSFSSAAEPRLATIL